MIYQESQNATIPQPPAGALSLEDASEAQTLTLKIEDFKAVPVVQIPGPTCHQQADLVVMYVSDPGDRSTGV